MCSDNTSLDEASCIANNSIWSRVYEEISVDYGTACVRQDEVVSLSTETWCGYYNKTWLDTEQYGQKCRNYTGSKAWNSYQGSRDQCFRINDSWKSVGHPYYNWKTTASPTLNIEFTI